MYCPKCELEIKGEDQKECPICNSPLIESPFEKTAQQDETADDDDQKLKELIEDIDEEVTKTLEENVAEDELKSEELEQKDAEPSESEFKLELEEQEADAQMEASEEEAFILDEYEESVESTEDQIPSSVVEEEEAKGTQETIEGEMTEEEAIKLGKTEIGDIVSEEIKQEKEPEDIIPDETFGEELIKEPKLEIEEEPVDEIQATEEAQVEESESTAYVVEEQMTTKDVLDRALDELDATEVEALSSKRTSIAKTISVIVVLLIAVVGGAYYLIYHTGLFSSPKPEIKVAKKEEEVLKKLLKKDVKEPAATVKKETQEKEPGLVKEDTIVASKKMDQPKEKISTERSIKEEDKKIVKQSEPKIETVFKQKEPVTEKKDVAKKTQIIPSVTYAIHAGSFKRLKNADIEASRYKSKGFDAYVERSDLGGKGIWYRIKVGRFNTKEEAKKVEKELQGTFKNIRTRIIKNKPS